MATNIAEIGFAADSSQLRSAKTALDQLAPSADKAEAAANNLASGMNKVANAAAGVATASRTAAAAAGVQESAATAAAAAQAKANATLAQTVPLAASMSLNTGNIAAQFQDIAVSAAGGMSPLLIAMQQGTQLSAALATTSGGAAGAMTALGAAAKSVVSPLSLAVLGVVGLVAGLLQLVPWAKTAAYVLRATANGIDSMKATIVAAAPIIAGIGAVLLVAFGPTIIAAVLSLTAAVYGFVQAMVIAAVTNPFIAIPLAIGAAIAAVVVFRKELYAIFGAETMSNLKAVINYIIGIAVGLGAAFVTAFKSMPTAASVAYNEVIWLAKNFANSYIALASDLRKQLPWYLGGDANGIEFRFDAQPNIAAASKGAADVATAVTKAFTDNLKTDWVGTASTAFSKGVAAITSQLRKWADALTPIDPKLKKIILSMQSATKMAELEQASIGMTAEKASVLKEQLTLLDKVREEGLKLTPKQIKSLLEMADTLGRVKADTEKLRAAFDFSKDVVRGFVTDLRDGLMQGETFLKSFLNAVTNILTKVSNKLIDLSIDMLFQSQKGGATGGILGGLVKFFAPLMGLNGNTAANGTDLLSNPSANGAVKMAKGGVVGSTTAFQFASGGAFKPGIMGEAGPEAVMPLARGPDGSLGVQVQGVAAAGPSVVVVVENNADNTTVRQESSTSADGRQMRRIIIDQVRTAIAGGETDGAMRARFGMVPTRTIRG